MCKCNYCGNKLEVEFKKCNGCGANNNYYEPIIKHSFVNNNWVKKYAIKDKKTLIHILKNNTRFNIWSIMLVFNNELETSFLTVDKSEYKPTIIFDRNKLYMMYLFEIERFVDDLFDILLVFRTYEKSITKLNEIFHKDGKYSSEYIIQNEIVAKNKIEIDKIIKNYER